jgi:hypothetical protein
MSRKITAQFEVRNMLIMKDTLAQMGINYKELNPNCLQIGQHRSNTIKINAASGEVTYDSDQERDVNSIKQNYMVNVFRDKTIREGNRVQEEVTANGEVILHVLR